MTVIPAILGYHGSGIQARLQLNLNDVLVHILVQIGIKRRCYRYKNNF